MNKTDAQRPYDVVVLGAGIGGAALAAILARHGAKVLLADAGTHPRFAIGESTVPATSRQWGMMADHYDVPELGYLAHHASVAEHIAASSGIKKNFGFVYHREGESMPRENEAHQLVLGGTIGYEAHLYRQDVDMWLTNVAVRYGAELRMASPIEDLDVREDGVTLKLKGGVLVDARCVIDGCGAASPFAKKMGLREQPTRLRTESRSIFTHMVDVKPFDDSVGKSLGNPVPWNHGTLQHMWEGGWLWIIPFNNTEKSRNPFVSVGLQFDLRYSPHNNLPPEVELRQTLERFPAIAKQFTNAKAVRPWVKVPRLQYSSTKTHQGRYMMLAHTSGFVDPLFSRGLATTTEHLQTLAWRILQAIDDDDFSDERFAYSDKLLQKLTDGADQLIYGAFTAWRSFDLWDAWFRLWILGQAFAEFRLVVKHLEYRNTGDRTIFKGMEDPPHLGLLFPSLDRYADLWAFCVAAVDKVDRGEMDASTASREIFQLLKHHNYGPPLLDIADRNVRFFGVPKRRDVPRGLWWMRRDAPKDPTLEQLHKDGIKYTMRAMLTGQTL